MPWWGWLLVGVGAALLAVLVLWLIFRRRGGAQVDRSGLNDSERTLEAERRAKEAALAVAARLEAELRGIAERKKQRLEELDEKTAKKFRDLTDDPDALLARLDEILGGPAGGGSS